MLWALVRNKGSERTKVWPLNATVAQISAKRSVDSRNLALSKGVLSKEKREDQRLMSIVDF
jgi:hypothetical protein